MNLKKKTFFGFLDGSFSWIFDSISVQVLISGLWVRALHWAPHRAWSLQKQRHFLNIFKQICRVFQFFTTNVHNTSEILNHLVTFHFIFISQIDNRYGTKDIVCLCNIQVYTFYHCYRSFVYWKWKCFSSRIFILFLIKYNG